MHRRLLPFVVLAAMALIAAAPAAAPEELIRQANAAFLRGDAEAAEALYAQAEERTGDPGLVAFNKAAVYFQKSEFYAAEVLYARTLDDKACPADRAARAWFNRGTCLLRRGGSASIYRSAIACFERALELPAADDPLKADLRYNLELAKLLWAEANKKAAKQDNPNERTREEEFPDAPSPNPPNGFEPGGGASKGNEVTPGKKETQPIPTPKLGPAPKVGSDGSKNPTPGDIPNPQPLLDDSTPQKLDPEETREYLRRTEERFRQERRNLPRPPDRPGVRDW